MHTNQGFFQAGVIHTRAPSIPIGIPLHQALPSHRSKHRVQIHPRQNSCQLKKTFPHSVRGFFQAESSQFPAKSQLGPRAPSSISWEASAAASAEQPRSAEAHLTPCRGTKHWKQRTTQPAPYSSQSRFVPLCQPEERVWQLNTIVRATRGCHSAKGITVFPHRCELNLETL